MGFQSTKSTEILEYCDFLPEVRNSSLQLRKTIQNSNYIANLIEISKDFFSIKIKIKY